MEYQDVIRVAPSLPQRLYSSFDDMEKKFEKINARLDQAALKPYLGRVCGLVKVAVGVIETISSLFFSVLSFVSVIALSDRKTALKLVGASLLHVPRGVKNVGLGLLQTIPYLGIRVATLQLKNSLQPLSVNTEVRPLDEGLGLMVRNEPLCTQFNLADRILVKKEPLATGCILLKLDTSSGYMNLTDEHAMREKILQIVPSSEAFSRSLVENIAKTKNGEKRSVAYSHSSARDGYVYEITGHIKRKSTPVADLAKLRFSIKVAFFGNLGEKLL